MKKLFTVFAIAIFTLSLNAQETKKAKKECTKKEASCSKKESNKKDAKSCCSKKA